MTALKSAEKMILMPRPRKIIAEGGALELLQNKYILSQGAAKEVFPIARRLQEILLQNQQIKWQISAGIKADGPECAAVITIDHKADIAAEGYELNISAERIKILASAAAGAFYAVMTVKQMLRQTTGALAGCRIEDYPDFDSRGLMLDVSRDKVPTLETLFLLVDQLAELKINHLELYFESAFAYSRHPEAWAQCPPVVGRLHLGTVSGTPITGEDILRLDAYCRQRFIELVPNQNSFGHLTRWLVLPRYNHLAECPDGFDWPWPGGEHADFPWSLDPTNPESITFLADLYDELLPHFTSSKFNVGCDETHDLGQGKNKEECQRRGKTQVYFEFLLKIRELVKQHGREMHIWADAFGEHPELLSKLPKDVVLLEWGYSIGHPYDERCGCFAEAGAKFYVCPSTSTFNSLAGRHYRCLDSIRNAAVNGHKHGAAGFLNTDWGGGGHIQYLPVSYLGYLAGAAASWCNETYSEKDLPRALDLHVFDDSAKVMGKIACELGNVYLNFDKENSPMFNLLWQELDDDASEQAEEKNLITAQEQIDSIMAPLDKARMNRPDAALIQAEFANAARFMQYSCRYGLAKHQKKIDSAQTRKALADNLREALTEHCRLWMARNRKGGLDDACYPTELQLEKLANLK